MPKSSSNILVIKLGALGDFIQAMGPMAAIRKAHPGAYITLLTIAPFEGFARACGYFDCIWIDEKPGWLNIGGWWRLRKKLRGGHFSRVYDLQNNDRSCLYFKLFTRAARPEWVGTAKGASHQNASPERTAGHAFDGHVQTLGLAGITNVQIDTLGWLEEDISAFNIKAPYILLVPGSAPNRPEKRWPAAHYGALAQSLSEQGNQVVILGSKHEKNIAQTILEICPAALNLTGQTSLAQIVTLARTAIGAIGNDTGPMHLIAATNCATLTIFSKHSHPIKHAPKGENATIIQKDNVKQLEPKEILKSFHAMAYNLPTSGLPKSSSS